MPSLSDQLRLGLAGALLSAAAMAAPVVAVTCGAAPKGRSAKQEQLKGGEGAVKKGGAPVKKGGAPVKKGASSGSGGCGAAGGCGGSGGCFGR
jgi:hypothetical protein